MRGDGATHWRSPESPWLSIVLVDALWSPAVTTRLAPAAPGRPQPAQVLDRRGEHERSAAPPIRRSRPGCFTPRWRGAPKVKCSWTVLLSVGDLAWARATDEAKRR